MTGRTDSEAPSSPFINTPPTVGVSPTILPAHPLNIYMLTFDASRVTRIAPRRRRRCDGVTTSSTSKKMMEYRERHTRHWLLSRGFYPIWRVSVRFSTGAAEKPKKDPQISASPYGLVSRGGGSGGDTNARRRYTVFLSSPVPARRWLGLINDAVAFWRAR